MFLFSGGGGVGGRVGTVVHDLPLRDLSFLSKNVLQKGNKSAFFPQLVNIVFSDWL